MLIGTKIHYLIDHVLKDLNKEDPRDEDTTKSVNNLKREMTDHTFEKTIVGALQKRYNVADGAAWVKRLNGNDDVLRFEYYVCDCVEKTFCDGRPEDMGLFSTGHMRAKVENSDPLVVERVMAALRNIPATEEIFEFAVKVILTAILRRPLVDRF